MDNSTTHHSVSFHMLFITFLDYRSPIYDNNVIYLYCLIWAAVGNQAKMSLSSFIYKTWTSFSPSVFLFAPYKLSYYYIIFPIKFNQLMCHWKIIFIASQHNGLTMHMPTVQKFAGLNMVKDAALFIPRAFSQVISLSTEAQILVHQGEQSPVIACFPTWALYSTMLITNWWEIH